MAYRKPNVRKRRAGMKSATVVNARDIAEFRKLHPEHGKITPTEYRRILKRFHENIVDEVIDNASGVSLPQRLGTLIIVAFPTTRRRNIDFAKSNELGETVYHSNLNTDGRVCKIGMYKKKNSLMNHRFWIFKPTKSFRKQVSDAFNRMWQKYIYVDSSVININSMLR